MIQIENENDRNLKNIKQIGTPREENRIYIENMAYKKIKEESYREKNVFVLMGHTERMGGKYATFVEAVLPVYEIEFSGVIPRWNNGVWSKTFREIKRLYEDLIIVGWALDVKGMSVKMTPDLERVHREHFGGVHQLLFLLDTLEQDETLYIYKENKLVRKDGFYIYYKARGRNEKAMDLKQEKVPITVLPEKQRGLRLVDSAVDVELEVQGQEVRRGGRYRQIMQEKNKPEKATGNAGIAIAVAMLIFIIGIGIYENSGMISGKQDSIYTNLLQNQDATEDSGEDNTQTSKDVIEIEVVPGGE